MLVLLPDGKYLRDFAAMLRKDDKCYTFNVENTSMLCPGHPLWDPKAWGEVVWDGMGWLAGWSARLIDGGRACGNTLMNRIALSIKMKIQNPPTP